MKYFSHTLVLLFALLFSCSSKSDTPNDPTVLELLTSGSWTSVFEYQDDDKDGNFTLTGEECDRDNVWSFLSSGEFHQTEGPELCNPNEPLEEITANWRLENNDQYLVLVFFAGEIKFEIEKINETEMTLLVTNPNNPSAQITHKIEFQR